MEAEEIGRTTSGNEGAFGLFGFDGISDKPLYLIGLLH